MCHTITDSQSIILYMALPNYYKKMTAKLLQENDNGFAKSLNVLTVTLPGKALSAAWLCQSKMCHIVAHFQILFENVQQYGTFSRYGLAKPEFCW